MKRKPLLCRLEHHPKTETIGVGKTLERCSVCGGWITWASKFLATVIDFGFLFFLLAALAVLMQFTTGCATTGANVEAGWLQTVCRESSPSAAKAYGEICCLYENPPRWRLHCRKDGEWRLVDSGTDEPEERTL